MTGRPLFRALIPILFSSYVSADITTADAARTRGDYDTALAEYRSLARDGDDAAQATLGYMYYIGEGVSQDYREAINWYRQAATQGNPDAQYNLAVAYAFGEGVEQDFAEAVRWYGLAAEQDHAVAQYSLGLSYSSGEGVEQNAENVAHWLARSAENGYVRAQVLLGSKYHTGNGVPLNYQEAARWYTQAAKQGDAIAQFNLGSMYRSGTGVTQDTNEAIRWYQLSSEQGYAAAAKELENLERDVTARQNTARTAAMDKSNNPTASEITEDVAGMERSEPADINDGVQEREETSGESDGLMAMDNLDPSLPGDSSMPADELVSDDSNPTQTDESMPASDEASEEEPRGFFSRLFGRSARETSAAAVSTATTAGQVAMAEEGSLIEAPIEEVAEIDFDTLNSLYSRGMSALAGRNYDEAVGLFRSAAAQGDPLAQYQMATLYYQGLGVNQDYETAALWYRRAAEQGNVDAQYSLGNMYLMGEGIPQNDARARHWYKEAASQGHTSARHNLDNLDRFSESSDLMTKEDISAEITGIDDTLHMDVEDSIRTDGPAFKSEPAVQSNAPASLAAVDYERGLAYSFGEVVPKNMETAFDYFRKAAEKGYAPAQYKLGVAYAYAEGTAEDKKQAIYWYKKAALQGHTIAQRNLGVMYETGDGIPRDKQQALAWYSILADSGNVMDVRRKEQLHSELSMEQLEESERIKNNLLAEISVYMK